MLQNIKGIYLPCPPMVFVRFITLLCIFYIKKELKIELPFRRKILSLGEFLNRSILITLKEPML